ncbi:MAG TPA: PAS domain S-box protein [Candidatus Angelobacter sp.]|jgi:PAS domain S-box-containing protein
MRTSAPKKLPEKIAEAHPSAPLSSDDPPRIEAQYSSIIDQLPQAMWVADSHGAITYCNQQWYELTGLTCDQTVEKGWTSILHREDRPRALANWRKLIASGVTTQAEYRFRRARDGEYRWHLVQLLSLKNGERSVLQRAGIAVDIHAQKATELELRKREDQLNLAVEAGRFGTWDFFLAEHRFSSSYRARAMFGRPPDVELTFEEFVGMLHPDDRNILHQAYIRALEPSGLSEFEINYRIIRTDGTVRWIAARGKGIFSGAGSERKPVRLIGTVQDITERKAAEEALRESEEKFRTAFHSNPEAMTITTLADGVYLDVNDAFLRVTGFSREDVMGRKSVHVGSWVELEHRARMVQALAACGRLESMETSFHKKNGEIFQAHLSAEMIEIGNIKCVLATSQDVSERTRVTEELRRSEEQYRSLIDRAPYGICRISAEGRFLLVNPALARMLGYESPSELLELDLATQVYEDPAERTRIISTVTQDMSKAPPIETQWKRQDGRIITVRLAGTPIRDGQGRLLHSEVFVERVAGQ